MNSRRARVVIAVAAFAYVIAVLQRTSLGVAGVAAADRFQVSAALLSTLAVVQLAVYAGMQIPVGVLIDRLGPRVLMLSGLFVMIVGQTTLALSTEIGWAIAGRVLVGAGDATIFVSMMRLVASWFSGRIVPQLSQWVGNTGQLGQLLSAVPLAFVLREFGWSAAFLSAASLALLAFALVFFVVADHPRGAPDERADVSWRDAMRELGRALKRPGTRLGFWAHFVTQSSGTVFALFWGFPFLVYAVGLSEQVAAWLLVLLTGSGLVIGPVLGVLTARYPNRRSNVVLGIVAAMGVAWAVVLLWPGVPPTWLLAALIIVIGVGGPGSMIGFDYARTFNPARSLGSANGIVNVGGFSASFLIMLLVGIILDALDHARVATGLESNLYALDSFRVALSVQFVVVGAGVVGLLIARRRTRAAVLEQEGIAVAPLWVAVVRAWKGRNGR
ncbi:MFS transporter [Agromyces atrinae]|uniref:MFS transporter n=1 Tax=Agromyces atrinae TaxID=592376 RepID=A0A4Q2M3M1_9MICO|nr:MFS transporter [Agromyces atrinae]MCI2958693.1 MFS transporter [Agromyces atrinae]NYD66090.1 sugar phosphate permease [Agromyces atrinae]RXZ86439.1 MFS transporter [Agromyces atrinae]